MNPILELLRSHRTIRSFERTPLPREDLHRAVAAAQQASTSSHVQAYSALHVTAPDQLERLVELCGDQPQVRDCGAFLAICGDTHRHRLVAADRGAPYAPNLETFLVAVIDAALFAQNLGLACESLGYGICLIGGLRNRLPEVIDLLRLPVGVYPLFGLCIGRPAADPGVKPRLPLGAVLHEGQYPDDEQLRAAIAEHDREMAAYYAARGRPGRDWSGGLWRKFAAPTRVDLLSTYERQGARLR
jgi:nitroreductase